MFWKKWKKNKKVKFEISSMVVLPTMNNSRKIISLSEYNNLQTFVENSKGFWLVGYEHNKSYRPMVRLVRDDPKHFHNFCVPVFRTKKEAGSFLDYCSHYFEGTEHEEKIEKLEVIKVGMEKLLKMYKATYKYMDASGVNGLDPIKLNLVMVWPTGENDVGDYPVDIIDTNFYD